MNLPLIKLTVENLRELIYLHVDVCYRLCMGS